MGIPYFKKIATVICTRKRFSRVNSAPVVEAAGHNTKYIKYQKGKMIYCLNER